MQDKIQIKLEIYLLTSSATNYKSLPSLYKVTNTGGLQYACQKPIIPNKASPLRNYFELCLTLNGSYFLH